MGIPAIGTNSIIPPALLAQLPSEAFQGSVHFGKLLDAGVSREVVQRMINAYGEDIPLNAVVRQCGKEKAHEISPESVQNTYAQGKINELNAEQTTQTQGNSDNLQTVFAGNRRPNPAQPNSQSYFSEELLGAPVKGEKLYFWG